MNEEAAAPTAVVAPRGCHRRRGGRARRSPCSLIVAAAWAALQALRPVADSVPHARASRARPSSCRICVRHGNWILPKRNGVRAAAQAAAVLLARRHRGARPRRRSTKRVSACRRRVLSGVACLLVAAVATALYGGVAGAVSGLTLLTSFEWLRAATAARVDMTLTFGLTLVFVGLLLFRRVERRAWLLLVYAGAAWATLSKGIPGLAIPALQVLLLCVLVDRSLAFAWRLRPVSGLLAVLVIVAAPGTPPPPRRVGATSCRSSSTRTSCAPVGAPHFTPRPPALGHLSGRGAGRPVCCPGRCCCPASVWRCGATAAASIAGTRAFSALLWILAVFVPYAIADEQARRLPAAPLPRRVLCSSAGGRRRSCAARVESRWLPRALVPVGWVLAAALGAAGAGRGRAGRRPAAARLGRGALRPTHGASTSGASARPFDGARRLWPSASPSPAAAAVGLASARGLRRWGVALLSMFVCTGGRHHRRARRHPARRRRGLLAAAVRARRCGGRSPIPGRCTRRAALDYGTLFYWGAPMPVYDPDTAEAPPYLLLSETTWRHMSPTERRRFRPVPGLVIERGNNQGCVLVIQRTDQPGPEASATVETAKPRRNTDERR